MYHCIHYSHSSKLQVFHSTPQSEAAASHIDLVVPLVLPPVPLFDCFFVLEKHAAILDFVLGVSVEQAFSI